MNQSKNESSEPEWGRDTKWRQGMFLSPETAAALGIASTEAEDPAVVVISHDCDIAQSAETEPYVEVLTGKFIANVDGNYSHGKNTRTLHIECTAGRLPRNVAFNAVLKRSLPKQASHGNPSLAAHEPLDTIGMTPREKRILQLWLASRYHRAAFPDEFDRRLGDETGVKEHLVKALKASGKHIAAMFFDIDEGVEVQRQGETDTYSLFITLMYNTSADPEKAEEAARNAAERIEGIFDSRCRKNDAGVESWRWIELVGIEVIADDAITVAQSKLLSKWQGDHISLRDDPEQPIFVA